MNICNFILAVSLKVFQSERMVQLRYFMEMPEVLFLPQLQSNSFMRKINRKLATATEYSFDHNLIEAMMTGMMGNALFGSKKSFGSFFYIPYVILTNKLE